MGKGKRVCRCPPPPSSSPSSPPAPTTASRPRTQPSLASNSSFSTISAPKQPTLLNPSRGMMDMMALALHRADAFQSAGTTNSELCCVENKLTPEEEQYAAEMKEALQNRARVKVEYRVVERQG
ncbi:hypothetical protein CFIMG_007577RA00001 [Ceratocystis fimbriata CBS 114723]|uniref:Uncharacterized protein n=1 Tax=Ceratocystis fimbriata CBS 114723 TaxID=1035309 RepID=A0A2C5XE90_9PEZI|nr:hypothetical protein CFIMG_007577RA00001 [Ceratocystis fimbriata CBS 114723]